MNKKNYFKIDYRILLFFNFLFISYVASAPVHDIDDLKNHGETRDRRMKRKDPVLYKDLFVGSLDKRSKRLHFVTLEKATQLLNLFQERLLPAHPDESKKDQVERTRRLCQNSINALTHLCAKLQKEWSLDITYAIYKIGFAFAAFPHDEKAEVLKTLAVRSSFDAAFFPLYGINCFIKRMKVWDFADDRSIITKVKDKIKVYIHTMTQPVDQHLEAV